MTTVSSHIFMIVFLSIFLVTPLDTKYALLVIIFLNLTRSIKLSLIMFHFKDPELRAQVKRDALGLRAPVQQKPTEKASKAKAAPTKDATKSKPSKSSEKKENKPVPKTLPEALKLVYIICFFFL